MLYFYEAGSYHVDTLVEKKKVQIVKIIGFPIESNSTNQLKVPLVNS